MCFKALANEDTLLQTHCYRHKCFPVCPRAQHLLRTAKFCVRDTKNVSDFVQKHFASATNVFQFAQPKKHHGQQCVRNNYVRRLTQAGVFLVICVDPNYPDTLLPMMFLGLRKLGNICCGRKMFLNKISRRTIKSVQLNRLRGSRIQISW